MAFFSRLWMNDVSWKSQFISGHIKEDKPWFILNKWLDYHRPIIFTFSSHFPSKAQQKLVKYSKLYEFASTKSSCLKHCNPSKIIYDLTIMNETLKNGSFKSRMS